MLVNELKNIPRPEVVSQLENSAYDFAINGNNNQAALFFRQAAIEAESHDIDANIILELWNNAGYSFYLTANFIECFKAQYMQIQCAKKNRNKESECWIHVNAAHVLLTINNYRSALEEIQSAFILAEELDNDELRIGVKMYKGNYYRHIHEPDLALEHFLDVLHYYEKINHHILIGTTHNNIGTAYILKHDAKNAELYLRKAVAIFEEHNDHVQLVRSKTILGGVLEGYYLQGNGTNPEEGIAILEEALEDSMKFSLIYDESIIRFILGTTYEHSGNDERAAEEYLKVKELEEKESSLQYIHHIYLRLTEIEERRGNIVEALRYLKLHIDRITNNEKVAQKRGDVELEIQIFRMEEKRKNELLEKELQAKQQINEAVTFHTCEREQFLRKLHNHFELIKSKVNDKSKKQIHTLQKEIKDMLNSANEWSDFEQGFIDAHSELERKLTAHYPSLTPTERKVCILLRAGHSTKEIAQLLHISPDTADTHRTRIRKKLGLKQGTSTLLSLTDL